MPYLLNAIYFGLSMLLIPVWVYRMAVAGEYVSGFWSRLIGSIPPLRNGRDVIWLHGASIGEILSLQPIVKRLITTAPEFQVVISSYTRDGFTAASQQYPDAIAFYLPFDVTWAVRRAFAAIQPRLLILSELELWPNLLLEAKQRNVPVAVVSSRINDVDFRFFKRINRVHRPALHAVKWWGAQTSHDAERIRYLLGPSTVPIEVTGSLKYDVALNSHSQLQTPRLRQSLGFTEADRILVAGSTHSPEDEVLLKALQNFGNEYKHIRLILAPRDIGRIPKLVELLERRGTPYIKRSEIASRPITAAQVILIDTIGELSSLWELADFAFVGGSLTEQIGGHNMIEPAAHGKPICFGPNTWNFQEVASGLLKVNGARQVYSVEEIVECVDDWLKNPMNAKQLGDNAKCLIQSQCGATDKTVPYLIELLSVK